MKKILAITTFTLGLSAIAGSAFAASNTDMWGAKSNESSNIEEMAKEKGLTVDQLKSQFDKENKKVADLTDSTEGNNDTWGATSSESSNIEEMAKEKGLTVDQLKAQFDKENKKVADLTDSTEGNNDTWSAANSSEPVNLEEMAKEKGITVDQLIAQLEKEGTLTKAAELTAATEAK